MVSRMTRLLEIYVMPQCFGCETAIRLAQRVQALNVPGVDVQIVDLSQPNVVRPPKVFAVPTYVLNGVILSLGNPEEDWLLAELEPALPNHQETPR